jgi:hypothetical protein
MHLNLEANNAENSQVMSHLIKLLHICSVIRLPIGQVENRGSILNRLWLLPSLLFSEYRVSLPDGKAAGA